MKKLMIYPFNKGVCEIARYRHLLKDWELSAVTSPQSYGYEGRDISCLDGGSVSGIIITDSFEEGVMKTEGVLFVESTFGTEVNFYKDKIKYALEYGKEVMITKELKQQFCNGQLEIPPGIAVLGSNPVEAVDLATRKRFLKEINVPVLISFSMGEFCNGLDTELVFSEKFRRGGYKVSCISSNDHGELFGIHMLPDYMYKDGMPVEDKIVNFNWYAEKIVNEEQADLLLIEIKEAIMPYTDRLLNHFGVIPYLVANAVKADIGIMNLYYGTSDTEYFETIKNTGKYKYDIEVEYFNVSNTKIVINEFDEISPVSYIPVNKNKVLASVDRLGQDMQMTLFHILDEKSTEKAYQRILDELTENPSVVSIW